MSVVCIRELWNSRYAKSGASYAKSGASYANESQLELGHMLSKMQNRYHILGRSALASSVGLLFCCLPHQRTFLSTLSLLASGSILSWSSVQLWKMFYNYAGLWPSYMIFSAIFLWEHRILTALWRKATLCLMCLLTPLLLAVKISTRTIGQSIFRGCYVKLFYTAKEKLTPRFCLSHHSAQMLIIRLFSTMPKTRLCAKSHFWKIRISQFTCQG